MAQYDLNEGPIFGNEVIAIYRKVPQKYSPILNPGIIDGPYGHFGGMGERILNPYNPHYNPFGLAN